MKPIRIVTVAPTPYLDGPGKVILGILKHLDRSRFAPSFVSIIKRPESACYPSISDCLEGLDIPYRHLNMSKPSDLVSPARIASFLRRQQADVVHTHLLRGNIYGRVAARMAGIKHVISTVHGKQWMDASPWVEWSADALDKLTVGMASVVVAVSVEVRDNLTRQRGYRNREITVIPNGIDTAAYERTSSKRAAARRILCASGGNFVIGFVGRIDAEKNLFLLLDVMKRVFEERPEAVLVIVGQGRLRRALAERVHGMGLSGRVKLLGQRDDVPRLLSGFDAFFLPSRMEGHSLALCEAMAARLPCVTTPVGGTSVLIHQGKNGLLVRPDDIDGMVEAVRKIMDDRKWAARMGRAARETVRAGFSEEIMSKRYQKLYCDTVAELALSIGF